MNDGKNLQDLIATVLKKNMKRPSVFISNLITAE